MEGRLRFFILLTVGIFLTIALICPVQAAPDGEVTDQPEAIGDITIDKVNTEAVSNLRAMTPEEVEALDKKLAEALTLYYDNQYGKALPIFKEIADQAETMDIMWWLGNSAMKMGDTKLAIAKFKKMLVIDPSLHRVRLDLALAYFKLGYYDEARRELEAVRAAEPPERVRRNMDKLLAAIDERTKKISGNLRFSQGIMYDTNVSAGPSEQQLKVSGGTLTLGDDSKKVDDEALVTSLQGNVLYDFGERQGLLWNTEALFYNSAYQTYSKYNFMMADISTGPWWIGRRDILKVPVGYRDQYFGSERLSNIIHIDPSYEHYFGPLFSTKISYSYNKEFYYSEDNANLENNTQVWEFSPSVYLGNRRHIISGALGYENRDADARRFCYSGWYYALSYFTRFPTNTEFFLRYKYMEKDYKENPLLYSQDREDRRNTVTAVLSQQFCKYFFASLAFNYTDNNSSAGLYAFDKATYTFNIGFTF